MKLDPARLASDPMKIVTFNLPLAALEAIDRAASKDDVSCPNRSAFIRRAILNELRRQSRQADKEAA